MTRFEELCALDAKTQKQFSEDYETTVQLSARFFNRLIEFLEIPPEQIEWIPLHEEIKPGQKYGPAGAIHLRVDFFYEFGVRINLCLKPSSVPPRFIRLRFSVKRVDDEFVLKFGDHPETFKMHQGNEGELKTFLEFVFEKIKEYLGKSYLWFMHQGIEPQKIGFV